MRRLVALLLLPLVLAGSSHAEDRRADKTKLKVMSFNAEFLWDGVAPEEGSAQFDWKGDQAKAEDHMAKIAQVIAENDPDVVCLVEVENLDSLSTLNSKFLSGKGYLPYLDKGVDTSTGQDVGLLARIDPLAFKYDNTQGESEGLTKRQSKGFVADFEINDTRIAMIGVHFLAQPGNTGRRVQRQAQADAVRRIATQKAQDGFAIMVMGDLNDYDFHVKDHIDSTPIAKTLFLAKMMEVGNFDDDLLTVALKVPQEKRFTSHWDKNDNSQVDQGELTSIDHMLLSPGLFELVTAVEIDQDHAPAEVSDHFPIITTLSFVDGIPSPEALAAPTAAPPLDATTRQAVLAKIEALERELKELKEMVRAQ